ncbi:MAG: hypothetical protein JST42_10000 [Bacteroidetes bacterium]|nr:hypothetical protein [Bacteroidota bacterium]
MKSPSLLFAWAFSISFAGTLPPGTLNLSVADYAFRHDIPAATGFAIAAISVEITLVRVALVTIRRLERLTRLYRVFHILSCALLLFMSLNSLLAAWQMQTFRAGLSLPFVNPVLSGLVLSSINPLHLPFWMGWTAVLRSRKILDDQPRSCNLFVGAIGAGTAAAFWLYALAGSYLIGFLGARQVLLNWVIGVALLAAALAQLFKNLINRPGKPNKTTMTS